MPEIQAMIQELDDKLAATDDPIVMANIYYDAGLLFEQDQEIDEACFFMTQAFVIASHLGNQSIIRPSKQFLEQHGRI